MSHAWNAVADIFRIHMALKKIILAINAIPSINYNINIYINWEKVQNNTRVNGVNKHTSPPIQIWLTKWRHSSHRREKKLHLLFKTEDGCGENKQTPHAYQTWVN